MDNIYYPAMIRGYYSQLEPPIIQFKFIILNFNWLNCTEAAIVLTSMSLLKS